MQQIFVYVTMPDMTVAKSIASSVLKERLAAGVNCYSGVHSLYWWKGVLSESSEAVCIFKTTQKMYTALEKYIRKQHPYETPCIVAIPLGAGATDFFQWIEDETRRN